MKEVCISHILLNYKLRVLVVPCLAILTNHAYKLLINTNYLVDSFAYAMERDAFDLLHSDDDPKLDLKVTSFME